MGAGDRVAPEQVLPDGLGGGAMVDVMMHVRVGHTALEAVVIFSGARDGQAVLAPDGLPDEPK